MAAVVPPASILKAEKRKVKEKMELYFYQGRKVFCRSTTPENDLSCLIGQDCKGGRELEGQVAGKGNSDEP